ncbi:MAG: hypothetical protein K0S12_1001 [Bacteroidetes bacterium]|jgi:hypothetical protein|nr:hypothetical protein [Bacteroidota bacterium]
MFKGITSSVLICISVSVSAQKTDSSMAIFRQAEEELKLLQKETFYSRKESDRVAGNKKFIAVWDGIVSNSKILNYPFDSLKEISILVPKDNKFKLITWNLHKDDGTHAFFGYLLVNNSKRVKKGLFRHETIEAYEYFKLIDNSGAIKNPESFIGSPSKWFGMLYYSLIECDGFYTLLGYDPNDNLTRRKFVDVLYFKADGTPVFGKDVFKFPRKNPKRLMFEYSSEVSMSLRYHGEKNLNRRKQIVYSHLAPKDAGTLLEGQYQYYGPDGSFDALELKKDKWITVEDVNVTNEKSDNDKVKKPDPDKQTPIFQPK